MKQYLFHDAKVISTAGEGKLLKVKLRKKPVKAGIKSVSL
ncbi:hypothetical protein SAMN04488121_105126 [Chitinophaga filiformis]|uniref:Uncharacterized protein n=1 Tax=Chitinophaga filiformis TaxID=104663 RepID=A0A1G7VHR0_CHIFI|nr:hypothetical protein SAMN04488121_105126 [Chitinophaga filiformis]